MFAWGTQKSICTISVWNKPESGKVRHSVISRQARCTWFTNKFFECRHISFVCPGLNFSQHLIHKKGFSLFTDFPSITALWLKTKETFYYKNPQKKIYMLIYSHISLKYLLSHSCSGRVESVPCDFPLNVTKTQPYSSSTHFWQHAKPHAINANMHLQSVWTLYVVDV